MIHLCQVLSLPGEKGIEGCLSKCVDCYARYMKKFIWHEEPWGLLVDVKNI
jgi:hypothetical protein